MKKVKTTMILAVLTLSALSLFSQGLLRNETKRTTGENNILAIVEDKVITRDEVMKEVEPFIPQIRASARSEFEFTKRVNDYVREIVQNMVDRELIVKEFRAKGMSIPESYLESQFEDYLNREFNGDRAEFIKYIQSQSQTIKQFRKSQEEDIIVGYMQNQKRQTVAEISPKKIREFYDENKNKWYSPASVHIRQITLKSGMYSTLDENKKLAADIISKLKGGADFAELAKKYSKDDTSTKGGEWGWYKKGDLNPVLDSKVFALKAGEVTEPVTIGDMIFILKVEEKKEDGIQAIDDVREQIEWTIAERNGRLSYQKWVEDLRAKAYIKYYQ